MSERTHLFFKEGKLYLIPELPTEQHNLHLPVEIEKAKANALPVVNPEVADNTELPFPGNRIVRLRKENEIFEWPGTWEKSVIPFYVQNTGAKLIAPQQPQAEDDDRRGWPEHEEPIPNNKPTSWSFEIKETSMTQSDAPNEGIGKIPQWVIDYNDAGYTSGAGKAVKILMNIVSDHEFKRSEYLSEINSLRDQLSKEREEVRQLREEKENMHNAHCRMLDRRDRDLVKEREMRKELVGLIEDMRLNYTESNFEDYNYKINSLLEKASELDKNKT